MYKHIKKHIHQFTNTTMINHIIYVNGKETIPLKVQNIIIFSKYKFVMYTHHN